MNPKDGAPKDGVAESKKWMRRVRELEMMVQVSRRLNSTLDLRRLLTLISKTAAELVDSQDASIILEDRRTGGLVFLATAGPQSDALTNIQVPIEGSIAGTVFKTREPLIVQDTGTDPRHYDQVDRAIEFETQSLLAVPMIFKDRAIGVLEAVNKLGDGYFTEYDVQTLSTLAAQAAVAIENARLVSELQDVNTRLEELDRLKSDFIAIASHELRTPLGLIMGYASFLREEADGQASEQLDVVLQAAQQLQGLIEDMVNLTHLEAGNMALELVEFDLQDLIRDVVRSQQQLATTETPEIQTTLPAAPIRVRADQHKIHIVLNNLINNAIKFTPPDGRIQISVRPQTGMVAVAIANTGSGIPKKELERIFDRFYQIESHLTRKHGGMGLGLSIARGMVELHGGRIWAESVKGRGSCFTFTLPVIWQYPT